MSAGTLTLVVPLYNEAERVAEFGPELLRYAAGLPEGSELIFVDDGSADATSAAVADVLAAAPGAPARLLRRPHAGKGGAVRAGLGAATAEYAGFCDVDLSTPLDQFEQIVRAAEMSPVLAIGSRDSATSTLVRPEGRVREFLGKAYNRVIQFTLAPGISDTQCGAKVASAAVWKEILANCNEDGFAWDVEAVVVARRLGIVVREVAIAWHHDDRSRVRVGRDGARMLWALPRISQAVKKVPKLDGARSDRSGVFDEAQAATLLASDAEHWWFRSKGAFVSSAIRRHLAPGRETTRLVDVGAGAGGVTTVLGWMPDRLYSVDGSEVLCARAADRHALLAAVGLGDRLPFPDGSFGVVALLDVIEHLEDPEATLREAWRVLDEQGVLVVNVPAHQWLWSTADELLGHMRRYNRPVLRAQLASSGFEPVWMSHVFSWLVVPVWLRRRMATSQDAQLGLDQVSRPVGQVAMVLTTLEKAVVSRVPLPLGTSILCVARRRHGGSPGAPTRPG